LQSFTLIQPEFKTFRIGMPAILIAAAALALPSQVANYDFRHFTIDEGMTISFSRSAPPLAALEDERLPAIVTEPANEMKMIPRAKLIGAGSLAAWQHLQKYAVAFETRHHILTASIVRHQKVPGSFLQAHKPFSHKLEKFHAANAIKHNEFSSLTKISELTKLLKQVEEPNVHTVALEDTKTIREQVEEPLTGRQVERGLPRGEDAPPLVNDSDQAYDQKLNELVQRDLALAKSNQIITPMQIPKGQWKITQTQPQSPPQHPSHKLLCKTKRNHLHLRRLLQEAFSLQAKDLAGLLAKSSWQVA
jgi:hypothetical protein